MIVAGKKIITSRFYHWTLFIMLQLNCRCHVFLPPFLPPSPCCFVHSCFFFFIYIKSPLNGHRWSSHRSKWKRTHPILHKKCEKARKQWACTSKRLGALEMENQSDCKFILKLAVKRALKQHLWGRWWERGRPREANFITHCLSLLQNPFHISSVHAYLWPRGTGKREKKNPHF